MSDEEPYRVKVVGRDHPHNGKTGVADPRRTALGGSLVHVTFSSPGASGEDAAYAHPSELRRI